MATPGHTSWSTLAPPFHCKTKTHPTQGQGQGCSLQCMDTEQVHMASGTNTPVYVVQSASGSSLPPNANANLLQWNLVSVIPSRPEFGLPWAGSYDRLSNGWSGANDHGAWGRFDST